MGPLWWPKLAPPGPNENDYGHMTMVRFIRDLGLTGSTANLAAAPRQVEKIGHWAIQREL